jgi:PAS domain S-box-containing protein
MAKRITLSTAAPATVRSARQVAALSASACERGQPQPQNQSAFADLTEVLPRSRLFDATIIESASGAVNFINSILECSTEHSIISADLNGSIVVWNEGARRLYGYDPSEVIGKRNSSMLHTPEDVAAGRPMEILGTALREGKWDGTIHRIRKNGSRFTARMAITPRRDALGQLVGYLLISKDISDEIRLTNELEQVAQTRDRFLAGMSHELRTPLNAIIGFTGTLLMELPGPINKEQKKQLSTVRSGARHLLLLINDLLDLVKINSGKVELHLECIDCRLVISDVAETLRPMAEVKGLQFNLAMPDREIMLKTDRRAFSQVVINLLNNAIKFTENGTITLTLSVSARNDKTVTAVIVEDTGIGILKDEQEKLFKAFSRVGGEKTSREEGSGLGLHISRKLAELLGGAIDFTSEHAKGSTFSFEIEDRS